MIAFSLLISKGSPQLCVWKVFQDTLFPGGSKSYAVLSWEALPDHRLNQTFILVGSLLNLGSLQPLVCPFPLHHSCPSEIWPVVYVLIIVERPKFLQKCDQKGILNWRARRPF